jgi:rhodanese-related sulfurtransferase
LVADAKTRVREITLDDYKQMTASGDAGVLIDTREESEWAAGHAAGAIWLGKGIIERDIEAKVPDHDQNSCCIAAAVIAVHSPRMPCRRWATPT